MTEEEARPSPAAHCPAAAGCCTAACPRCRSSPPATQRAGKAPSPALPRRPASSRPRKSESVLLLRSRPHVVASRLEDKRGPSRGTRPVSAGGAVAVPPVPAALPGWGGGLKSVFLTLLGERELHLGGVLHHAGGGRRGALWRGTVWIGRQWGGIEKHSGGDRAFCQK